jgi:hypothetical protein
MPGWVRPVFVTVTLTVWAVSVFVMLWRNTMPDATFMGIPAAVFIAAAPPVTIGRNRSGDGGQAGAATTETEQA